ncbi:probable prolyl 4-hydroxylase 6 isoform X2 [Phoenix dactylifera]|uniref:procollagen-proline 4-dioxygenase n=1 Tax=Phoenix dactylifera TaxID=42345 RepID=A0A8B8ZWU2_PHODC|nr:probable prolyl 4-hydroxylase 6 isoform X2 [Phoenix dactylifera]
MGLRFPFPFSFLFFASIPILVHGEIPEPSLYDPQRVTQLSWRPRAFLYRGLLSDEECDHLIKLAEGQLEKSTVVDNESGQGTMSDGRTSSGTFLDKQQDEIVARIERRLAAWTFLPEENGEPMQILRYEKGQKYESHFDFFNDKFNIARGGHRFATVIMYLSNVNKGGETIFPSAEGGVSQYKDETWSDCARTGYAVKPNKGDALLFFSLHIDATIDPKSLHGSCPVIEGEKWSATKWIHVRNFDHPIRQSSHVGCSDEDEHCPEWAAAGECVKNFLFMVGTEDFDGFCRKSCRVCKS